MRSALLQSIDVPNEIPDTARSPQGAEAALLYRAGRWDEAHELVQDLETPEGRFWHGILHREEGDWSNAAYWFRRVGRHPVYPLLQNDAAETLSRIDVPRWHLGAEWDPLRFIQWCEEAAQKAGQAEESAISEIRVAEWRRLFAWCIS